MQLLNTSTTHYNVLNVSEDATQEEIRSSYKSALLLSHPDKNTTNSETRLFLDIQTAWEVLGDVNSRALYDAELKVSRQHDDDDDVVADEEVMLEDLTVDAAGDVVGLFYQCRCGDRFSLDSLELEEIGFELSLEGDKISLQAHDTANMASVVLPCASCSLKIRLMIINPKP